MSIYNTAILSITVFISYQMNVDHEIGHSSQSCTAKTHLISFSSSINLFCSKKIAKKLVLFSTKIISQNFLHHKKTTLFKTIFYIFKKIPWSNLLASHFHIFLPTSNFDLTIKSDIGFSQSTIPT